MGSRLTDSMEHDQVDLVDSRLTDSMELGQVYPMEHNLVDVSARS